MINDCNDQNTETEIIKGFLDSCANGNVHGRVHYKQLIDIIMEGKQT